MKMKKLGPGDIMYSMGIVVANTVLCIYKLLRE